MKRASIALAALIALTLTGCAGAADETPSAPQSTTQSTPSATPDSLVAETPAAEEADDASAAFVEKFHEVRATMPGDSQIPNATDEQLLAAADEACSRLDAGETSDTIVLIDGEEKNGAGYYSDSAAIMVAARDSICPEG
ncbi:DUF732 domain-containing protein [Microbacterium sp.]|uniref:DUF732 domain-containing protein n=1 Tax=Microbacterium sp. TaxID=51671 RepID=UPI003A920026